MGTARENLRQLVSIWGQFAPAYPFEYFFLDDDFERLHRADQQLGQMFSAFAVAIVIACLGLFALAANTAEQRTKEIGVRKVVGASVPQVIELLTCDFTLTVVAAFLIGAAAPYFVMQRWLEDFAYRIDLSIWMFILYGLMALAIVWLTVGYQTFRVATAEPCAGSSIRISRSGTTASG